MRKLRSLIVALAVVAAVFQATAEGHRGEKTLSLEAGYADYNNSALAGVEFTYRFSSHFRLAPSVDYVFRHRGMDALSINLNCHFPFAIENRMEFYPIAGINFSGWNSHVKAEMGDVSTRVSRFGINAGAGWGIRLGEHMHVAVAADYVLIKDFHGAEIMAKLGYSF